MHGAKWVATVLLIATPTTASAQTNLQLWGNLTVDWVKSDRLVYELDLEPKALVKAPDEDPGWANLDVTPNVEYSLRGWLDLVAEGTIGMTKQTDDIDTFEVTPRLGARFHVFSRDRPVRMAGREQHPTRRIVVRDLVRVESRNFFYSGATDGSDSSWRFRNRLEFLAPINTAKITDDGARYLLADWEWFVPIQNQEERFANKQRIRTGLGYRRSFHWRFEALYIWTRSRNTIEDDFATSDNIIDIRVKRVF
jgi:hypothetical protein